MIFGVLSRYLGSDVVPSAHKIMGEIFFSFCYVSSPMIEEDWSEIFQKIFLSPLRQGESTVFVFHRYFSYLFNSINETGDRRGKDINTSKLQHPGFSVGTCGLVKPTTIQINRFGVQACVIITVKFPYIFYVENNFPLINGNSAKLSFCSKSSAQNTL
jgi:hypothetical protein